MVLSAKLTLLYLPALKRWGFTEIPMNLSTIDLPLIDISLETIKVFCQKWKITEFSLFGSVLRSDFRPDSDLDVLVSFMPYAPWTLIDLITMQDELQQIVHRDVDLIEKRVIEKSDNSIRRNEILTTAQVLYSQVYEPA